MMNIKYLKNYTESYRKSKWVVELKNRITISTKLKKEKAKELQCVKPCKTDQTMYKPTMISTDQEVSQYLQKYGYYILSTLSKHLKSASQSNSSTQIMGLLLSKTPPLSLKHIKKCTPQNLSNITVEQQNGPPFPIALRHTAPANYRETHLDKIVIAKNLTPS